MVVWPLKLGKVYMIGCSTTLVPPHRIIIHYIALVDFIVLYDLFVCVYFIHTFFTLFGDTNVRVRLFCMQVKVFHNLLFKFD